MVCVLHPRWLSYLWSHIGHFQILPLCPQNGYINHKSDLKRWFLYWVVSPVEFIKLVMLCLLEVSFCLNLARQHWNSSNSFRKMHTECFYWSEKHVKVTLFLFNLSRISSVPDLWLKESVPEMSHLLSPSQTSETTLDWLQCVVKGLPIFMSIRNFQQVAQESGASTILRISGSCDIGQADVVMCGYQDFWVAFTWWIFSLLGGVVHFMGHIASMAMG